MAEQSNTGGGNSGLAFIVGGVVVALLVIAWFVFARGGVSPTKKVEVNVKLPEVSAPAVPAPQTN